MLQALMKKNYCIRRSVSAFQTEVCFCNQFLELHTLLTKVSNGQGHTVFLTLTEVFLCFSLSCKANDRVKLTKTGHGPHSSKLVVICAVLLLFVLFHELFVCKCVVYYCHWVTTQLQLTCYPVILSVITL